MSYKDLLECVYGPDSPEYQTMDLKILQAVVQELEPRRRRALIMRFGLEGDGRIYTFKEIAKLLGRKDNPKLAVGAKGVQQVVLQLTRWRLRHAISAKLQPMQSELPVNLAYWYFLTMRTANCLQNGNVRTLHDLTSKTKKDLMQVKNFGKKSLKELQDILAAHGLHLAN